MLNKTILVTGSSGCIGQYFIKLLKEKVKILGLDINEPENIKPDIFIKGTISNKIIDIFNTYDIDCIIHLAAFIFVDEGEKEPDKYYLNNTLETFYLLEYMKIYKIKNFIFASTSAVYKDSKELLNEESEVDATSVYGKSKLICEYFIKDLLKDNFYNYMIFRFSNICGTKDSVKPQHFIPILSDKTLNNNKNLNIYGIDYNTPDGSCIRDYIHVKDVCYAFYKAIKTFDTGSIKEIINLGSGKSYSNLEVVERYEKILKFNFNIKYESRRKGDKEIIKYDISKAKTFLDWYPTDDIDIMILDTWHDYKN